MDSQVNSEASLFQAFGVDPTVAKLQERNEVLLLRLSPSRYIKKAGSTFCSDSKHLIKLEIYNGNRLNKSFQVYESNDSEIAQISNDLFAKVCATHLTETVAATVNQYGSRK